MKLQARHITIFKLLLFIGVFFTACNKKIFDWSKNYDSTSKEPMGTYVLREELPNLFPNNKVTDIPIHMFNYLENNPNLSETNFLYIIDVSNNFSAEDATKLLLYVKDGNNLFLAYDNKQSSASNEFPEISYGLKDYTMEDIASLNNVDTLTLVGKNNSLKTYYSYGSTQRTYFEFVPAKATVLGYIQVDGQKKPNYISIPLYDGVVYLHSNPTVFSNYSLLKGNNAQYVTDVFSYLPDYDILWNNKNMNDRYRSYNNYYEDENEIWNFAENNPPVYQALMLLLIGGLLFFAFNTRRRQAAVAYVKPYSNDYLDYSSSLTKVYRRSQNFKYLTTVKISYFLHKIKDHYYLNNIDFNDQFAQQLHIKSQVPSAECFRLVQYINQLNNMGFVNEDTFTKLTEMLDNFYAQTNIYGK